MALYQPSNITPSSFAGIGAGVIDASDNVSIAWQVNGTSAMTGFTIKIYRNTTGSALVHTFTETLSEPFYGTDASGNPVYYVYEPGTTWAAAGLSNGEIGYKLQITQNWLEGSTTKSVVQNSDSVFLARAKPTLSISPASGTLSTVAQTFTGTYSQAQGNAVSWVRWILSSADGSVIDDTGEVYTGVLSYSYDGFFSGETYSLSCTVATSSGAQMTATNTYAVSYSSAEQTGGISLSCNADDSVTLKWSAGADIPGVPSAEDYGTISGGVLHLAASRSIAWSQVNGEAMSFSSPYCFAWRGMIAESTTATETVSSGTWELVKQYDQSTSTTATVTVPSLALTKPYTGNTTKTLSFSLSSYKTGNVYEEISTSEGEYQYDTQNYWYSFTIPNNFRGYTITDLSVDRFGPYTTGASYSSYSGGYIVQLTGSLPTLSCTLKLTVRIYYGSSDWTPTNTEARNPVYLSTTAASATVTSVGTLAAPKFRVYMEAYSSGSYSTTFAYEYTYTSVDSYSGSVTSTFPSSTGTLTGVSVTSTTGNNATATRSGNQYTVTVYYGSNTSRDVTVKLSYTYKTTGNDSYRSIVTGTKVGAISAAITSTTATRAEVSLNPSTGAYTVTMYYSSSTSRSASLSFVVPSPVTGADLATASDGVNDAVISIGLNGGEVSALLTIGGTLAASVPVPDGAWQMLAVASPGTFDVTWFGQNGAMFSSGSDDFGAVLPSPISSISAEGKQDCDYIYLSSNENYDFAAAGYTPGWDGNALFYASFASDLQAGTVSDDSALSVAIYRKEGNALSPVGVFGSGVKSVRDYAIRSGVEYLYEMFYIASGIYSAGAESETMCKRFRQHTLIEAEEDSELAGVYHPVNVWRFKANLDAGAYTNQNTPVMLENFTAYPLWQPSSPRAKSGTLVALLGRFVNGVYTGDDTSAMDKLFALSASTNPLFYRDMKGNLYMVRLAGPITQTINNKTGVLEVSVSVPWVEVGDADNVKIYTTED